MDQSTRKYMMMHKASHLRNDVDRIHGSKKRKEQELPPLRIQQYNNSKIAKKCREEDWLQPPLTIQTTWGVKNSQMSNMIIMIIITSLHYTAILGATLHKEDIRGVMVKAMNCGIVVWEFVLQSRHYVHFRANTLGKGMNLLILPAMG